MIKLLYSFFFLFIANATQAQLESRYDFGNAPPLLDECNAIGEKTNKKFAPPAGASFKITNMLPDGETAIATCLLYGALKTDTLIFNKEENYINYLKYNTSSTNTSKVEKEYIEYQRIEKQKIDNDKAQNQKKVKDENYKKEPQENYKITIKDVEENRLYFLIKVADVAKCSTPFYQTWKKNKSFVIGTQAKLIKIRLKDFDFAKDFSLASTFGFRYRTSPKKDNFLSFVGSIGVSLNDLDNNVATKLSDTTKLKNIGALTVGLGIIREYGKIQVSLMLGKDFLSKANQNKYNWIYNKKTWISFGVGIGIFTGDDGKKGSETNEQPDN